MTGLSGHADKEGLIDWIRAFEENRRRCSWYMERTAYVPDLLSA